MRENRAANLLADAALLKNGFNQSPAELLHQFLAIDLSAPALLNDDLALLNHRLDQLETSSNPK